VAYQGRVWGVRGAPPPPPPPPPPPRPAPPPPPFEQPNPPLGTPLMLTAITPRIANTSKIISVDAGRLGIVNPKIEIKFNMDGVTNFLSTHVKLTVISL
jgi:hypothetical protein